MGKKVTLETRPIDAWFKQQGAGDFIFRNEQLNHYHREWRLLLK